MRLANHSQRRNSSRSLYHLCCLLLFLLFLRFSSLPESKTRDRQTTICNSPSIQIAVLTLNRARSLQRLLNSLTEATYGCAAVDLLIVVDKCVEKCANNEVVNIAKALSWTHGTKVVIRRVKHAGLSASWFELPYTSSHQYLAIFEDDMQVNPFFYEFFSTLHTAGVFSGTTTTGFCLHPNDWELRNEKDCHNGSHSRHLYESPEPCNWGPIWKLADWTEFLHWVSVTKSRNELPYMRNDTALNWNLYLDQGKDVQSSWVWKYNWLRSKVQIRYTFQTCNRLFLKEVFFAINHKEPGMHFKTKYSIDNDPNLLIFDYSLVLNSLKSDGSWKPAKFAGYKKYMKSLRGK